MSCIKNFLLSCYYPVERLSLEVEHLAEMPFFWLVRQSVEDLSHYPDEIKDLQSSNAITGVQNIWLADASAVVDHIDWGGIGMIQVISPSLTLIPVRQEFVPGEAWDEFYEKDQDDNTDIVGDFENSLPEVGGPNLLPVKSFESLVRMKWPESPKGDRVLTWSFESALREGYEKEFLLSMSVEQIVEGIIEHEQGNPTYFS